MSTVYIDEETKHHLFLLKNDIERIEKRTISYTKLIGLLVEEFGEEFVQHYKKESGEKIETENTSNNSENQKEASIT